jgi:hypothetical protein
MATTPVGYPYTAWSTEQLSALISEILGNNDFDGATITGSTIDSSVIGGTTPAAATVTTLTATNAVALSPASHNVVLSPTGTGVVTINPATAGSINNVIIGATTPLAGHFTYVDQSVAAVTPAGSSRTDALQLAKAINYAATVGSGTGVILPAVSSAGVGATVIFFNADGSNACQVYGSGSDTIDGVAAATGVPLSHGKRAMFIATAAATWVSAQLGVVSA